MYVSFVFTGFAVFLLLVLEFRLPTKYANVISVIFFIISLLSFQQ